MFKSNLIQKISVRCKITKCRFEQGNIFKSNLKVFAVSILTLWPFLAKLEKTTKLNNSYYIHNTITLSCTMLL